jgi:hypothetical protein
MGASIKELGSQFRPALGFVSRRGVRDSMADVGYTRVVHGDLLQTWFVGADAERIEGTDGKLQTQVLSLRPLELETLGRDIVRLVYQASQENLSQPFTIYQEPSRRVVVPVGKYAFADYGFDFETGSQRIWAASGSIRRGSFYDGTRLSAGGNVTWRPSRNLGLKAGYSFNDISLPAGDFTTRIVSGTAEVAFNSFLSWVTLLQYDNVSEVMGLQTRLVWVPRAGRKYFLVANRGLQDVDKDGHFSLVSTEISLRAGYTWRF